MLTIADTHKYNNKMEGDLERSSVEITAPDFPYLKIP